ncbi:MAG TPA: N-acetyltransferase, partial [Acidimicrobiia bacterium]|nr:N-acetyltransferase [Acidimicrobiia bacterium]
RSVAGGTAEVLVLELDGTTAGFAELSRSGDIPSFGIVARCAIGSMGVLGALRAGWRARARSAVDIQPPAGIHLVELQVAPPHRNAGLGGRLLAEVERTARQQRAPTLSLTTAIDNPARRLYERNGFHVEAEKRHRHYEALTGSPGRVLMVKTLAT